MIDHVSATLKHWRQVPFSYATEQDCLMSLADYVKRVTGHDFGAVWRGRYGTEAEAFEFVREYGGAVSMIDSSGLTRVDTPQRGDIVTIDMRGDTIGGLFTGGSVALRLPRGVAEINSKLVQISAAWRVE